MIEVFDLFGTLGLNTDDFDRDLSKSRLSVKAFKKELEKLEAQELNFNKAKKDLSNLNSELKKFKAFDLTKEVKFTGLGNAKTDVAGLNAELKKTTTVASGFKNLGKDFSLDQITRSSHELSKTFAESQRAGNSYQETLRRFTPEVNRLASAVKRGSADQADYNRRISQLSPDMQKAIGETRRFGKEINELGAKTKSASGGGGWLKTAIVGGAAGGAGGAVISTVASQLKSLAEDGVKAYGSLDKLTRFTATLDKNFQTPEGLKQFRNDIAKLSTQIPHDADKIAQASFTVKSAYQNLSEPELISYLREFGQAASASNTDIATHTQNVVALAKQYGITAAQLPQFNALIASGFGQALAADAQVAAGFNQVLNSAKSTKQELNSLVAAMSVLQGASNDAEGNTTLLKNALEKLSDPKYIEGFKQIGISVFDSSGNFKQIGEVINEVSDAMNGLSDQDIAKKFDFLKDQQARQGFLTLARNAKAFNEEITRGGDAAAFNAKTNTMLNADENRWKLFWNTIENGQRAFGGRVSFAFSTTFSQQTGTGTIRALFVNMGAEIMNGFTYLSESVARGGVGLAHSFLITVAEAFGGNSSGWMSAAKAQQDKDIGDWFSGFYTNIEENRSKYLGDIKESQIKYFKDILASPIASEQVKTEAKNSLAALSQTIAEGGNSLKDSLSSLANNSNLSQGLRDKLKEELKGIGDGAKEGIVASKQKIAEGGADLKVTLNNLLSDARLSTGLKEQIRKEIAGIGDGAKEGAAQAAPEVKSASTSIADVFKDNLFVQIANSRGGFLSAQSNLFSPNTSAANTTGQTVATAFGNSTVQGVNSQKPNIQSAQQNAVTNNINAQSLGQTIGSDWGAGVFLGVSSWAARIAAKTASIVSSMIKSAQEAQDSHSPSRRAAREIGMPFVQGIVEGIKAGAGLLDSTADGLIGGLFNGKDKTTVKGKGRGSSKRKSSGGGNNDKTLEATIDRLGDLNSWIDLELEKSNNAVERFYAGILGDRTSELNKQYNDIFTYYSKLQTNEADAYNKRLANIADRENAIRQLKKMSAEQRNRELAKLDLERQKEVESFNEKGFRLEQTNGETAYKALLDSIAKQSRATIRIDRATEASTPFTDSFKTKEQINFSDYTKKFALIDEEMRRLKDAREDYKVGTKARIDLENEIEKKIEERSELEVSEIEDAKKARHNDLEDRRSFVLQLREFGAETVNARLDADRQEIDMLVAFGAKKSVIRQKEFELAKKEEEQKHLARLADLAAKRDELTKLTAFEDEKLRIIRDYNILEEEENRRHANAQAINAQNGKEESWIDRLKKQSAELPTLKENFTNFAGGIGESVGNIFANAVTNWDGTFKGFFKSIGRGFADLAKELIAQMIKILVYKAIFALIGAFAGGASGGTGTLNQTGGLGGFGLPAGGFAYGGFVSGPGTGTSDSIHAKLSNGEFVQQEKAVRHYGVPFMNAINNLSLPRIQSHRTPAFAGGGSVSGNSSSSSMSSGNISNSSSVINQVTMHVHTPDANSFRRSDSQIRREMTAKLNTENLKRGL